MSAHRSHDIESMHTVKGVGGRPLVADAPRCLRRTVSLDGLDRAEPSCSRRRVMRIGVIALALLAVSALDGCHARWGSKDEARLCEHAIGGRVAWPADACRAMHVCANEARLSAAQRATLTRLASARGCAVF